MNWKNKCSKELLAELKKHGIDPPIKIVVEVTGVEVSLNVAEHLKVKYDAKIINVSKISPLITIEVDSDRVPGIAKMPHFVRLWHVPKMKLAEIKIPMMKALEGVSTVTMLETARYLGIDKLKEKGLKGAGVKIAFIDSGIDRNHPMLTGKVVKEKTFVGGDTQDRGGHGTSCSSLALGRKWESPYGVLEGMAPEAEAINAKCFDDVETTADILMAGVEWASLSGADLINCLAGDTPIMMNHGTKPINQIEIGDHVYSLTKEGLSKKRVKNVFYSGKKEVFEINTGNRLIKASADHPFLVYERLYRDESKYGSWVWGLNWKNAGELKKRDRIVVLRSLPDQGKPYILPNGEETTGKFMEFMGCYLGDGYITIRDRKNKGPDGWIGLCLVKKEIRRKYGDIMEEIFNHKPSYANDQQICLYNRKAAILIEKLNLGRKAIEKKVPKWVFKLPHNQIKALLRGFVDADGHIMRKGARRFTSTSKDMMEDMRTLAMVVGYKTSRIYQQKIGNHIIDSRGREYHSHYPIWLFDTYTPKWGSKGFPYKMGRKSGLKTLRHIYESCPHIKIERIFTIKRLGVEETYDITVEGSHNFFADGFLVHNCSWGGPNPYEPMHMLLKDLMRRNPSQIWGFSCGNDGPREASVDYPSGYKEVVAVGSVAVKYPKPDAIANFSSRGPAYDGTVKPDIVVPGGTWSEGIVSAYLNGEAIISVGTSLSCPTYLGGLACIYPTSKAREPLVKASYESCRDLEETGKDNLSGYGVPRFDEIKVDYRPPPKIPTWMKVTATVTLITVGYYLYSRVV